ncbi:MAG: hypothetical protein HY677_04530 [Chloroflexi bacterium]|nr:hypothetical protein [Chloroflexota bacterium]
MRYRLMQRNETGLLQNNGSSEAAGLTALVGNLKRVFPRMTPPDVFRAELRQRLVVAASARGPEIAVIRSRQPSSSVLVGAAALSLAGVAILLWRSHSQEKRSRLAAAGS